jgi:hypothetical protein
VGENMYNEKEYECNSVGEVQAATTYLDTATVVPIFWGLDKQPIVNYKGIYNNQRKAFCTVVGDGYNVVQHKDYFDSVAESLDRLGIKFKMTLFQQGNKAYADIDFINKNLKFDKLNEEFVTGFRVTNSYNKMSSLIFQIKLTRLACMNGMILSQFIDGDFSVRHNQKLALEIDKFVEIGINKIINGNTELQTWISDSMLDSTEWINAAKLIEKLFERFKHREQILKRLGIACVIVKDTKTKQKIVTYVNDKGLQNITKWQVYNAITEYCTQGAHITPMLEEMMQKKAEMILTKPFSELIIPDQKVI